MSKSNDSKESLSELTVSLNLIKAKSNALLIDNMVSNEAHRSIASAIESVNSYTNNVSKELDKGGTVLNADLNSYIDNLDKFSSKLDELSNYYREDLKTIRTVNKNNALIEKDIIKFSADRTNLINSGTSTDSEEVKTIDQAITLSSNNLKGLTSASQDAEKRLVYHKNKFEQLFKEEFNETLGGLINELKPSVPLHKQILQKAQENLGKLFSKSGDNMKGLVEVEKIDKIIDNKNKEALGTVQKTDKEKRSIKWDDTTIKSHAEVKKKEPYLKLKPDEREELEKLIKENQLQAGPLKDLDGKDLDIKSQLAKQPVKSILKKTESNIGKINQRSKMPETKNNLETSDTGYGIKSSKDKLIKLRKRVDKVVKNVKKLFDPNLSDLIKKEHNSEQSKPKTHNKPKRHNSNKNEPSR